MNCIRGILTLRLALFALGVVLLPAGLYKAAMAQGQDIIDDEIYDASDFCNPGDDCEVESVADILASTYYGGDTDINTYNATFITFDLLDYGYEAYVEGYLYQDGSLFADGSAGDDGSGEAQLDGANPLTLYDYYELDTDSYITDGIDYYGFPCDGCTSAAVEMDSSVPSLTSVNPTDASVGTQGTLTLSGSNFLDPFGGDSYVNYSGTGVTFTLQSFDDQSVVLTYSIQDGASTGEQTFTIQDRFGTSDPVSFNVGDATPVVTSVNPGTWQAGTQFTVTISGQHFGTNPSVSLLNATAVTISPPTSSGDTQIQATVTASQDAPNETVTVQVQSNGYGGSGFVATYPGESPDGTNTANVVASQPPSPQILFNGTNVAGMSKTVYIGQQIALTGVPPSGYSINSGSWSGPDPANSVGGYGNGSGGAPDTTGGHPLAMPSQTCPTSGNCTFTYYYVASEPSDTVTLNYALSNGSVSTATVTFNATGPSGNLVLQPNMLTNGLGVQVLNVGGTPKLSTTGIPVGSTSVGITFTSNAQPPSGTNQSFTFIQLLTSEQRQYVNSQGAYASPPSPASGLDNTYPYVNATNTTTNDTPNASLPAIYGEGWETFSAIMYLTWDPGVPAGGQGTCKPAYTIQNPDKTFTSYPSTCASIPVPLSSVSWHWSGCAINTLANQANTTTWMLSTINGCPVDTLGTPQATGQFPEWSTTVTN